MSKVIRLNAITARRQLITALAAGSTWNATAHALGYNARQSACRLAREQGIRRQRLPCGVPVIIANAKPSEPT